MANSVETIIRSVATNKLSGKYNLAQYKEGAKRYDEKVKAMTHKKVCEEIVAFADTHKDIPFYLILAIGVAQNAPRLSEANKGYKAFNAAKVEAVYNMGMAYYSKKSTDWATFLTDLNNSKIFGKKCGSREIAFSTLCKNLNIPTKEKSGETESGIVSSAA